MIDHTKTILNFRGVRWTTLLFALIAFNITPIARGESLAAHVTGVVIEVDQDGVMWLADLVQSDFYSEPYPIREWALDIEPAKLELLTLGRKVTCTLFYKSEKYNVATCVFEFRNSAIKMPVNPSKQPFGHKSISYLAHVNELGVRGCNDEDQINEPYGFLLHDMCNLIKNGLNDDNN